MDNNLRKSLISSQVATEVILQLKTKVSSESEVESLSANLMNKYNKDKSGTLSQSDICNILIDAYRSINKAFQPTQLEIESFAKQLNLDSSGPIRNKQIKAVIRAYLGQTPKTMRESPSFNRRIMRREKKFNAADVREEFNKHKSAQGKIDIKAFKTIINDNIRNFDISNPELDLDELFDKCERTKLGKMNFKDLIYAIVIA